MRKIIITVIFMFFLISCHKEDGLYIKIRNNTEIELNGKIYLSEDNKTYNKADEWQFTVSGNDEKTIFIKPTKSRYFGVQVYGCSVKTLTLLQEKILEYKNGYQEEQIEIREECKNWDKNDCTEESITQYGPECSSENDGGVDIEDDNILQDINNDLAVDLEQDNDLIDDIIPDIENDASVDIEVDNSVCIDNDGDSFGINCESGPDCDETEVNCTDNCDIDVDSDQIPDCRDSCINCTICPENAHEVGSYYTSDNINGVTISGSYAFVVGVSKLRIIDISNVTSPQEVGFYDTSGNGVVVSGSYAFVAGVSGLRIIDISKVTSPQEVGFYNTPDRANGVTIFDNYAFIADWDSGLRIIDISNVISPQEVGFYDTSGRTTGVALSGSYAFVSDSDYGLRIIDISNVTSPQEVGFYDTSDNANGVTISSSYAFIADGGQGLRIINISNINNPHEEGYYYTGGYSKEIRVYDSYAFMTDGAKGLHIINISNLSSPYEAGSYVTEDDSTCGVAVSGSYAFVVDYFYVLRIISLECE